MTDEGFVTDREVVQIISRIFERYYEMPGNRDAAEALLECCDDELDTRTPKK